MPKSNNIQLYIGIDGLSSYVNKVDKDPSYEHYVRGDWDTESFQVIYPVALPENFVLEQTESMIRLTLLPRSEQWRLKHAM